MQRHQRHRFVRGAAVAVHHQRDVFEKTLQVLELFHRAHQFFQVVEPAGGVGGAVLLPHLGIAALVEHDFGELGMRGHLALRAPAVEMQDEIAQRPARLRLQLVGLDHGARRLEQGNAALAGVVVQHLHGGVAKPALRDIDDALEGEIVGGRIDHAQVGQRVADFGALVKPRTADHAIGQAERHKTIFELAHLERGPHQDRDLVEVLVRTLQFLDLLADGAGFLFRIPGAGDGDLFAVDILGAQRLAEPAFIMRDQMRGGGEDMAGGAVIAFEADDFCAGKIVIEAQDVVDLRAAPAIDRLVVVADAADVFEGGGGRALAPSPVIPGCAEGADPESRVRSSSDLSPAWIRHRIHVFDAPRNDGGGRCPRNDRRERHARPRRRLRQQPQPQILRDVGVLIFVDQNELEPVLVLPQHVGMLAEQPDVLQQEIAEIGGVENLQPLLVAGVEFAALAVAEHRGFARRHLRRRQPAILPAVDQPGQHARRPALVVDVLGLQKLLEQPHLIVDVEHGEIGFELHQFGVEAQDAAADRVEGAEPRHALHGLAEHLAEPQLHLARGLVGEGHRQDFLRARPALAQDVGDPRGQHAGLAGAGAGQHQNRSVQRLDRFALFRIEPVADIAGRPRPAHARRCRQPLAGARGRRDGAVCSARSCSNRLGPTMAP